MDRATTLSAESSARRSFFSSQDHGIGLANDRFLYETIDGGKQWIKIGTDKYGSLAFKDREYVWLVSENALFRIDLDTTP